MCLHHSVRLLEVVLVAGSYRCEHWACKRDSALRKTVDVWFEGDTCWAELQSDRNRMGWGSSNKTELGEEPLEHQQSLNS